MFLICRGCGRPLAGVADPENTVCPACGRLFSESPSETAHIRACFRTENALQQARDDLRSYIVNCAAGIRLFGELYAGVSGAGAENGVGRLCEEKAQSLLSRLDNPSLTTCLVLDRERRRAKMYERKKLCKQNNVARLIVSLASIVLLLLAGPFFLLRDGKSPAAVEIGDTGIPVLSPFVLTADRCIEAGAQQELLEYLKGSDSDAALLLTGRPLGRYSWQALDIRGSLALLITRDIVMLGSGLVPGDRQASGSWQDSPVRAWLNGEFLSALSEADSDCAMPVGTEHGNVGNRYYGLEDQAPTTDRVFLLDIDEVRRYFPDDESRVARYQGEPHWWFLRTDGRYPDRSAVVSSNGNVYMAGYLKSDVRGGVRPALWIPVGSAEDM